MSASVVALAPSSSPAGGGGRVVGCPGCGTVQRYRAGRTSRVDCGVCGTELERTHGTGMSAALAFSLTGLLLLLPANLLPIYRVTLLGGTRESHLLSGAELLWREGFALPAIAVLLFAIVLPLLRFALLCWALAAVRLGRGGPGVGRVFRWAQLLGIWAMPDVMLLGVYVAYGRLHALFALQFEAGGWFLVSAGLAALLVRACLNERMVWSRIGADGERHAGPTLGCRSCSLVMPADHAGQACPRCAAPVTRRAVNGTVRATALVIGGLLCYLPANLLPIAATNQLGLFLPYTVLKGVHDLVLAKLWGLAALVFTASFAIPLLKLAGLGWCLWSIRVRSRRHLRGRTRLFWIIHEIGRWSMVDIFAIATFVPLMQFGQLAGAEAMPGASAFLLVVVLTMLATHAFDPRVMWDVETE